MSKARRTLEGKEVESVSDEYTYLLPLEPAFPNTKEVVPDCFNIGCQLAQCERSFSALGRIDSQTTIIEHRLADISLLSLENDLCSGPSFFEDTVCQFEGADKNRTIVLS